MSGIVSGIEPLEKHLPVQLNVSASISYQLIPESFYYGLRKEVTENRLVLLTKLANELPKPRFYGQFLNDKHYLKTLELLLLSTEETRHRKYFLITEVLSSVHSKNSMLDVGIGDGTITRLLGRSFNSVTIIDNNQEILSYINKKQFKNCFYLNKIHASITDYNLPGNCYNLILLSHVLYYIDNDDLTNTLYKAFNALMPGGSIVIVLSEGLGKTKLMDYFGKTKTNLESSVLNCISTLEAKTTVYLSREAFMANDINTMLHIAGFLLKDNNAIATKDNLAEYLNKNNHLSAGKYEISTYQKFIVITKYHCERYI